MSRFELLVGSARFWERLKEDINTNAKFYYFFAT